MFGTEHVRVRLADRRGSLREPKPSCQGTTYAEKPAVPIFEIHVIGDVLQKCLEQIVFYAFELLHPIQLPTVRSEFAAQRPNFYWTLPPETILLQQHFQWDSGGLYGSQSEAVCGRIFWRPIAGRSLHLLDIKGVLGRNPQGLWY